MDTVPRKGEKGYEKKRTIRLDGFEDDYDNPNEYYADMSARLDWMDKNWSRYKKSGGDAPDKKRKGVPLPSARDAGSNSDTESEPGKKEKSKEEILSIGQRIFRTRYTCGTWNGEDKSNTFIFNVWMHEAVKYFIFLFLMTSCTFAYTSSNSFYLTTMMRKNFVETTGFEDIKSVAGVWEWLEGPFIDSVYSSPMTYNRMVSVPRMRMQKVRPDSCVVHEDFQDEIDVCYDAYSRSAESEDSLPSTGNSIDIEDQAPGTTYTSLPGSVFALPYLRMYWAGGFLRFLPSAEGSGLNDARTIIQDLKEKEWLNDGARILLIDLQYYNSNINLYSIIRLSFEIPATGGVIPFATFETVHVKSSSSSLDVYTVICEILYMIMIGYYLGEKVYEMRTIGVRSFFRFKDTKMSFLIVLLSAVFIIFKIVKYAIIDTNELQDCDPTVSGSDCYLANFVFWQRQFENILAVITFLAWISLFKFFSDFQSMAVFTKTLSRCSTDLLSFIFVYMLTYLAYAQLGVLIFGGELDSFRNIFHSLYTLFRVILGDFDFHAMESSNRIMGPIYFISYVFFVFFILLNMFLAIISDTYSEVKAEMSVAEVRYPISEHIRKIKVDVMKKLNCYDDERDTIADVIKNLENKDEINWERFRIEMMNSGVNEEEVRGYFEKYDIDGNLALDKEELARMQQSLMRSKEESNEIQKDLESSASTTGSQRGVPTTSSRTEIPSEEVLSKIKQNFASAADFDLLAKRVSKMENTFSELTTKVDGIIVKLDQIGQKQKTQKYDQLTTKSTGSEKRSKK